MTSFLQTAVFLADRLLLGRYSQEALASMQVQGPLLWSLFSVFTGVLVGAIPLVSRCIGAEDRERASAAARASLRLALILGVIVAIGCALFLQPIVRGLGPDSEALRSLSIRYIRVALCGFPQMFVATTAAMILAASGNTRTPFAVGIVTNLLNVVLNLLLIFGASLGPFGRIPALGVTGSAAGSVVAFSLESSLLVYALSRAGSPLSLGNPFRRAGEIDRKARRDLLRLSTPALAERIVIHAGYLCYSGVITRLGALVMASNQALITLESICFLSADGFGIAAGTLVGQSLGRRAPEAARHAGWLAAGIAATALSALGLGIWSAGEPLLSAFVPRGQDGSALVGAGMSALPLLAASQPFLALSVVLSQSLRGAGDTRTPLVAAVLGGALVRVTLVWWLGMHVGLGMRAVWLASLADWIVRTALLAAVFARGHWRRIEV
jgi:MATE family, multidrug efflux pump